LSVDRLGVAAARELYLLPMRSHLGDAREYLESVRIISSDAALRDQIAGIDQQMRRYEESVFSLAHVYGTPGQVETLQQADQGFAVITAAIESSLEDVHTAATKRAIATRSGVEHAANIARWTVFAAVAFTSLIGAIVAVIVWRRINGAVAQLITFSGRVAGGDFSARAPQGSEHEFAILARAMNQMAQSLENSQAQLRATARRAGMAEIATNVLHNVGNILNSVNVSAALVMKTLRSSRALGLARAVRMMNESGADLGGFLTRDEKGKLLPAYLDGAAQALMQEQQGMLEELEHLARSIGHIKDVVATQQSYAMGSAVVEPLHVCNLADDAVRINGDALERQGVTVAREFAAVPVARLDRARLLQILVNLISNAGHAMESVPAGLRQITLSVHAVAPSRLRVSVKDHGEGIPAQNLAQIFTHGFTTRKAGHGFGLHSCALAARQMGGTLTAHSDGPGLGATFTLDLPIDGVQAAQ
ncbi:MAG: integral rane sensor signal transduction histidine kinase, partial [Ramlibacter sp.]|nr:integral rane sensor signal transduction histidine kinase [Ramlibacter sp.]